MSAAAAWLYKATDNLAYLTDAEDFYVSGTAWAFDWNDDNVGAAVCICIRMFDVFVIDCDFLFTGEPFHFAMDFPLSDSVRLCCNDTLLI